MVADSRIRWSVAVVALATVVAACGSADSDRLANRPSPDLGIDAVAWPDDFAAARRVLDALPDEFGGQPGQRLPAPGEQVEGPDRYATVTYGEFASVVVSDDTITTGAPDGSATGDERVVVGAPRKLAVLFGLVYSCDEDTVAGTAVLGPDQGERPTEEDTEAVWFSCAVRGAEGDPAFTASAVGWTGGRTAWLVIARDDEAASTITRALVDAVD